jgi:hypothetical protein
MQIPQVGCGPKIATVNELTGTSISAGAWNGDETFPPVGVNHLEAGTYCISGDFVIQSGRTVIGDGVLLIIEDGKFQISGGANVTLSAPGNGKGKGLLIYMPIQNKNRLVLNGGAETSYRGTILAPGADVHLTGMESKLGFKSQIIGYTIDVDGMDIIVIKYKDEQNYDAFKMPEVLLSQ